MVRVKRWWPLIAALLVLGAMPFVWHALYPVKKTGGSTASGLWTCSMHPQIRLDHPGRCPICGMDLVSVITGANEASAHVADHLALSEHARQMARVETVELVPRLLFKE